MAVQREFELTNQVLVLRSCVVGDVVAVLLELLANESDLGGGCRRR